MPDWNIPLLPRAKAFLDARGGFIRVGEIADFLMIYGMRQDGISHLGGLGLSAEDIEARKGFLGGSEIKIIAEGDPTAVNALWRVKTGRAKPEDLSDLYHVVLGNATEPFNAAWLEKVFSKAAGQSAEDFALNGPLVRVERRGERVYHPRHQWAACTLDGFLTSHNGESRVLQFKHVNGFSKIDAVTERYQPQCQWEAMCAGADGTILAVAIGTNAPEYRDIELDPVYAGELMAMGERFMGCVRSDTPPHAETIQVVPAKAPKALRVGERDMTGNNAWADAAAEWLANKAAVETFKKAEKDIKEMVPEKIQRTFGHGIEVVASKAGALSIKPLATPEKKD